MNYLEISNLKKSYKQNEVVKGISFFVKEGEILSLLGPNGAGKSTTINILSTALKKNSGEIRFLGKPLCENQKVYKNRLGIVPQNLAIFENLPAVDNVKYFGSFYGLGGTALKENALKALQTVGLSDRAKDLPRTFSGGMKRRLNIACALVHNPSLLILDEPTVGIDPQSRNHILESVRALKEQGTTILYTTHYMEEAEAISDRILIMDEGSILAEGTLEELQQGHYSEEEPVNLETIFLSLTGKKLRD